MCIEGIFSGCLCLCLSARTSLCTMTGLRTQDTVAGLKSLPIDAASRCSSKKLSLLPCKTAWHCLAHQLSLCVTLGCIRVGNWLCVWPHGMVWSSLSINDAWVKCRSRILHAHSLCQGFEKQSMKTSTKPCHECCWVSLPYTSRLPQRVNICNHDHTFIIHFIT